MLNAVLLFIVINMLQFLYLIISINIITIFLDSGFYVLKIWDFSHCNASICGFSMSHESVSLIFFAEDEEFEK